MKQEPQRHEEEGPGRSLRVWICIGLLCMAIGCGSPHPPEQPARWANAWIESLNSHRIQQVTPLLDPAATYQDPLTGKPLSGQAITFFFVSLWNATPASHYEVRRVSGNSEFLAVEWSATDVGGGTATKPLEGVFLIHFNGERIASVRGYYNAVARF